ncbi:MAG: glycosyltransferase family 39 protein [Cyanobacteria bacterium P01_G01_bin.19]
MSIPKPNRYPYLSQSILLFIFLLLGCYFRFANLSVKIFWVDEIATVVRASGYTIQEVTNHLARRDIISFNDLISYQNITPEKTFIDSWNALIKSPEHAPLYFVLTRFWMQIFGSSISTVRSFSAVSSLFIFPALYWLCQELFNRQSTSTIALLLMSISPFYVTYAQEARPYSLWTVSILLISASLLKAIRVNTQASWVIYSVSLTIGLYTSLFTFYIAFFQAIYLLSARIKYKIEILKKYALFSLISLLAFSPWIVVIISHLNLLQENTSWMRGNFNLTEIIAVFIGTILLIFGDLPISPNSNPAQTAIALIVIVFTCLGTLILARHLKHRWLKFALLLIISSSIFLLFNYVYLDLVSIIGAAVALCILSFSAYSIYYLILNSDHALFIICLIISLPLPLLVIDIINQGQGSTAPRYLIPLQLGIQIAAAHTIANKIALIKDRKIWQFILSGFLILGIFSCIRNFNLSPFYQKGRNINNPAIAQIINRSDRPLVAAEADNAMDVLSLAYSLSLDTQYKIIDSNNSLIKYSDRFEDIFILKPSVSYIDKIKQNPLVSLRQVYKSQVFSADEIPLDLWQIHQ